MQLFQRLLKIDKPMDKTLQLFKKLRPYLKVKVLGISFYNAQRDLQPNRGIFSVKCTSDYLWGHYYAGLRWDASPIKKCETRINAVRPTFEQFCLWYRIPIMVED